VKAEQDRVAAIHERIAEFRGAVEMVLRYSPMPSAQIAEHIEDLKKLPLDDSFQEYKGNAEIEMADALRRLEELRVAAVNREAEDARLAVERAELDRQRAEQVAREKAQEKADAELAEIGQMRMQEIMAMGHQVLIATTGRNGVRVGGTRECIVETLEETRRWEVTDAKFGPLTSVAMNARTSACEQISALLAAFDQRVENERVTAEQAAESTRIRQERETLEAAQRAEQERKDREAKERYETEQREEREENERAEAQAKADFVPTLEQVCQVLAAHFEVTEARVLGWLENFPSQLKEAA
jgi:hypothetical protein